LVIFTGSVDSDPGNQTGRGILSYLSICSENTKKEFISSLGQGVLGVYLE
jgi:hypothetical protein